MKPVSIYWPASVEEAIHILMAKGLLASGLDKLVAA